MIKPIFLFLFLFAQFSYAGSTLRKNFLLRYDFMNGFMIYDHMNEKFENLHVGSFQAAQKLEVMQNFSNRRTLTFNCQGLFMEQPDTSLPRSGAVIHTLYSLSCN